MSWLILAGGGYATLVAFAVALCSMNSRSCSHDWLVAFEDGTTYCDDCGAVWSMETGARS